jgi:hypothetical protein
MNRTCRARRKDGEPCRSTAGANGFCLWHDPERAAERDRARKTGGAHKATHYRMGERVPPVLRVTLEQLVKALKDTGAGTMDPRVGSAQAAIAGAIVRVYEASIGEQQAAELERRIAQLEQARPDGPTLAVVGRKDT